METKIKVMIADPNEEFCTLLSRALSEEGDLEVVAAAADGVEALRLLEQLRPDVLLLELILPKLDGLGVLQHMSELDLPTVTLVVSAFCNEQMSWALITLSRSPAISAR